MPAEFIHIMKEKLTPRNFLVINIFITLILPAWTSETNFLREAESSSAVGGLYLVISSPRVMYLTVGVSSFLSPKNSKIRTFSSSSTLI